MSIRDELAEELKAAMRAKDVRRRDVIRQVETEISTARSDPTFEGEVDDDLYRRVIGSYVKKMEKSRAEYEGYGDRGAEMAAKLGFEVDYLSRWLPDKLGEEATREIVEKAIAELDVGGEGSAAGRVMGHVMKSHGAVVDGGLVNRLVRETLARD